MKTNYIIPSLKVVDLKPQDSLLIGSQTDYGENAVKRQGFEDDDEWDDITTIE